MKIIEKIYNAETGEETIIEREETKAEAESRKDFEKMIAAKEAKEAKEAVNIEAKAALLKRLGITEDEAKLLLG